MRLLHALAVVLVAAAVFAGICAAGVATSMGESFSVPPPGAPAPVAQPIPAGRLTVAVVLGSTGSVTADALAPFEVFARSDRFFVYTVAAARVPLSLSGGLHVLPDRTFAELTTMPDVVVVPAVVDPTGAGEAELRDWITAAERAGSRILGVCSGAEVLAAAGLLDGRRATSFWSNLDSLAATYPRVDWARGERYVEDGLITTTAGVSSGTVGALRLVEQLVGELQAQQVGAAVAYPGWSTGGDTAIPVHHYELADLPYALNAAFPWGRPTVGLALADGVGEIDVAAVAELYSGVSFAARAVPIGAGPTVRTRHGMVLLVRAAGATDVDRVVVAGGAAGGAGPHAPEFGFDPVLRDLARNADRATAVAAATFSEYPSGHLDLDGPAWPWRSTALAVAALLLSAGVGLIPVLVIRRRATARAGPTAVAAGGRAVTNSRLGPTADVRSTSRWRRR